MQAVQIKGLKLWFWSEDHEPPHFHAKKSGEWEIRVFFLHSSEGMIEIKWAEKSPTARMTNTICELARTHRVALLEEWEKIHP